jgi:hypothetical protein
MSCGRDGFGIGAMINDEALDGRWVESSEKKTRVGW